LGWGEAELRKKTEKGKGEDTNQIAVFIGMAPHLESNTQDNRAHLRKKKERTWLKQLRLLSGQC